MTRTANNIALGHGTDRLVHPVSGIAPDRSALFAPIMNAVRRWLPGPKVAEQFAAIINCEPRSAARYLAGDRTPDGNQTFAMLVHPTLGPPTMDAIMAEAERRLSPDDFRIFQLEMVKAATRAFIREQNEVR